jgi:DNA-binding transcriptional regulator YiaG
VCLQSPSRSPFMPNINAVVNEQIRRLARREITASTKTIKRATGHYRRDIAALKRQVAQLVKLVGTLQKQMPAPPLTPPAEVLQKSRLRVSGLKAHRARLGLSAKDYGKLMGVSGLTIYHWEAGKSKPRRNQLAKIVAVRGIGKREALQRLGMTAEKPGAQDAAREIVVKEPATKRRIRGTFQQTAKEFILSLFKGRKMLKSGDINAAWKKAKRAASADNTLSLMVKAKTLKRTKIKGEKGSEYRVS